MLIDRDAQNEQNMVHAHNPEVGDYWVERILNGVLVVLDVTKDKVVFCKKKKQLKDDKWTWDLSEVWFNSRKEFREYLEYGTMPGKYWADVRPGMHLWAVEEYLKIRKNSEKSQPVSEKDRILYEMARLLRNTDGLFPVTWGSTAARLLRELRRIDNTKYDKEVMI